MHQPSGLFRFVHAMWLDTQPWWCCRCQVVVRTDDLELAGVVVQDAAAYLGLADLASTAHFPTHMQQFQAVMAKVSTCHVACHIPTASAAVWVSVLARMACYLVSP